MNDVRTAIVMGGKFYPVLCYKEEGRYVAHCLPVDLRGWGDSLEEAYRVMAEMLKVQIEFATQLNEPELLDNPAEEEYYRKYDACKGANSD